MSDQGDHSDIEEEKLLGKDESEDAGDRDESSSRVVPSDSAPMTRGDFQIMTKQNERILQELDRLKRKRSHSRSRSKKRVKGSVELSDTDRSLHSHRKKPRRDQNGDGKHARSSRDTESDTDRSQSKHSDTEDEEPAHLLKSLIQKTKTKPSATATRPISDDETDTVSHDQPRLEASASAAQKLDKMQKELEKNAEEGPDIEESLAKILHGIYENINQRKDDSKDKSDKIRRPANLHVRVPRVNVEAWQSIDYHTKENDLMLQKRQTLLLKSAYNMAVMCDSCIKSSHAPMIDMMENLVESIQLNMKAVHEISLERRRKILNSPGVNKKYKNPPFDLPVTDLLFGADMKSFMTQCDNTSKLGNTYYPESRSNRGGHRKFSKNGYGHHGEWNPRGRGGHQSHQQWTKSRGGQVPRGKPSRPSHRGRPY